MINKQTIISAYDEKLTLVQWLKSVNKALDEAVLTNVEIAQRGNATFVFVFTFEDGTQVESNEIIVNQGESIVGATIENGHLLLTLSNDDVLDAGNVKPVSSFSFNSARHLIVTYGDGTTQDLGLIKGVSGFSINESQHLIVTYDNGTTEDLGAIFDGNVNIDGNFTANSIIETMSGYSFSVVSKQDYVTPLYCSQVKNGNKITIVVTGKINMGENDNMNSSTNLLQINVHYPTSVGTHIIGLVGSRLDQKYIDVFSNTFGDHSQLYANVSRTNDGNMDVRIYGTSEANSAIVRGRDYAFRYEVTFLLSENMLGA